MRPQDWIALALMFCCVLFILAVFVIVAAPDAAGRRARRAYRRQLAALDRADGLR